MRIEIFDVGHGGCAVVTAPNGRRLMLDCGFNADRGWFPSVTYSGEFIDLLVPLNLDEDHLGDLPYLLDATKFGAFFSNPTVSAAALKSMKRQGMDAGVTAVHGLLPLCRDGLIGRLPELGEGMRVWTHWNRFGLDFADTNNLSLAVFVRYAGMTVLFTGDLETKGWRALLRRPDFIRDLQTVNVLVASHHGRDNGQCPEAFQLFQPDLVIFSDTDIRHGTQETSSAWYGARTRGVPDFSAPRQANGEWRLRRVMTTRRDGSMAINVEANGRYLVYPERRAVPPLAELFGALPPPALPLFSLLLSDVLRR